MIGDINPGNQPFIVQKIDEFTVVEFRIPSLMDAQLIEQIGQSLYKLVDEQDRRKLILDFSNVQYLSSSAIGFVLNLNKKLKDLKYSKFILCGVGEKLMQLIKITRLDKLLIIKPTQKEALRVVDI